MQGLGEAGGALGTNQILRVVPARQLRQMRG
jgi:hypothetical protein